MSFVDLDKLSPEDLILHYVLECRGRGHFLPYSDYQIIDDWLKVSPDADELLLVLSDVLPSFFQGDGKRDAPRSLGGANRRVLRRLKDRAMRRVPGVSRDPVA